MKQQELKDFHDGVTGTSVLTFQVFRPQDMPHLSFLGLVLHDEEARSYIEAISTMLTEIEEGGEHAPTCLGCNKKFKLTEPGAFAMVRNFKETRLLVSGICRACLQKGEASGDITNYFVNCYKDIWPDLAPVRDTGRMQ